MKPKYLIWPGHVRSKFDKQLHYISARQIAELYRVNPRECVFVSEHTQVDKLTGLPYGLKKGELIELYPDRSGRYQLPKPQQEDK